jgi:lipopolysaccharide biosynthesis glycosyltransferase
MNIAFVSTLTKDYILGLKVFIKSIIKNNPDINYDYIIFEEEMFSDKDRSELLSVYKYFKFLPIDKARFSNITFSGARQWNVNPANRLQIFTLTDYEKIIFFDVDMLCTGNISEIFNTPGDFLACYHHMASEERAPLGFEHGFNCGVMVIDRKFCTEHTIAKMLEVMKSRKWLGNQSTFNLYFKDTYKLLPSKYFLSTPFMNKSNFDSAVIYHFAGGIKPWHNIGLDQDKDEYLEKKYCKHVIDNTDAKFLYRLLFKYNTILTSLLS